MWRNVRKLNKDDLTRVKSIFIQMYAAKEYEKYHIEMDENESADSCSISVHEPMNPRVVMKFMFFPDTNGILDSIAIYGLQLVEQLQLINDSKQCFGFDVLEASYVKQNTVEPFVDIKLKH